MTNCKNCGAVLKSDICEYCGTDYRRENKFAVKICQAISRNQMYELEEEITKLNHQLQINEFRLRNEIRQ